MDPLMHFVGFLWRIFLVGITWIFLEKLSFDPLEYVRSITVPLLNFTAHVNKKKDSLFLQNTPKESLIDLCEKLTQENTTLQLKCKQQAVLEHRLLELEKLLKIHENLPIKTIGARIIKREISAWNESFFINKGEKEDVCVNDLVLSHDGIIGKITAVQSHCSIVLLTSDPKFHLSVKVSKDLGTYPSIYSGKGYEPNKNFSFKPKGIVKNIPIELKDLLCPGDEIIPALFQDSFCEFPIGWIESWREQGDGLFLEATIRLPDTHQIRNVLIIHNPENPIS